MINTRFLFFIVSTIKRLKYTSINIIYKNNFTIKYIINNYLHNYISEYIYYLYILYYNKWNKKNKVNLDLIVAVVEVVLIIFQIARS